MKSNKYTEPKKKGHYYFHWKKIPRKLKKDVKKYCGCHWAGLTNNERMWYYLEKNNLEYKWFLICKICKI